MNQTPSRQTGPGGGFLTTAAGACYGLRSLFLDLASPRKAGTAYQYAPQTAPSFYPSLSKCRMSAWAHRPVNRPAAAPAMTR